MPLRTRSAVPRSGWRAIFLVASAVAIGCAPKPPAGPTLAGDWDVYVALGSTARSGFEGWRRMGFAHFAGADSQFVGAIVRRAGATMLAVAKVTATPDSTVLEGSGDQSIVATWHGDTLSGVMRAAGKATGPRLRLVRRTAPFVVEKPYDLWPGAVSDSQYAVTEDTAVFMTTRDGAKLVSYVARPVGPGPFGVVMQRTPYTRILHPAGRFWASRGYIFVAQHVRGRDVSDGNDFGDYDTDVRDGYDAVEWAATLPGANGKVGLIGHSDEGRLAWYAAVSAPPHLAAIAPSAATGDPWRIVPYEDMVFSPINVAWACLMREPHAAGHRRTGHRRRDHPPAVERPAAAARVRPGEAVGSLARPPHARRLLACPRRHHQHREGARAGAADLRMVRRFTRTDRLHERAGERARPSVHPAGDGTRCAQGRGLRGRRVRPAVARGDAPAAVAAGSIITCWARTTASTKADRSTSSCWATTRGVRKRRGRWRARCPRSGMSPPAARRTRVPATARWTPCLPPARRPTRSPTIRPIRRPISSIPGSSRRRSTRTSPRSTPRGGTRWCSRRGPSPGRWK